MKKFRLDPLIKKNFLTYIPATLLLMLGFSFSEFIDSIIVSKFIGESALVITNACIPFQLASNSIAYIFAIGGSLTYARFLGERKRKEASKLFLSCLVGTTFFSLLLFLAMFIFAEQFANILVDEPSLVPDLIDYIKVMSFLGFTDTALLVMSYFLIAVGNPKISTAIIIGSNVINVGLDLLFILVFKMGIKGAALATILGNAIVVLGVLIFHKKTNILISLPNKESLKGLRKSAVLGLSAALSQIGAGLKLYTFNQLALVCGGYIFQLFFTLYFQISAFHGIVVGTSCESYSPIASTYIGEKDLKSYKKASTTLLLFLMSSVFIFLVLCSIFATQIAGLYSITNPDALYIIKRYTWAICLFLLLRTVTIYFKSVYVTNGKKKVLLPASICDSFLIIPVSILFTELLGFKGLLISFVVEPILTVGVLLLVAYLYKRKNDVSYPLLIEKKIDNYESLNIEYKAGEDTSVIYSQKVIEFLENNKIPSKTSVFCGIIIEDLTIYTQKEFNKNVNMNIIVKILDKEIILLVRCDGKPFNSLTILDDEVKHTFSNKEVFNKVATSIDYSRLIGINSTIIHVNR